MVATTAPVSNEHTPSSIVDLGTSGDDQKSSSPSSTHAKILSNENSNNDANVTMNNNQSRRDLIGDCALVEIIHLHDCLRGALNALEKDLIDLSKMLLCQTSSNRSNESTSAEEAAYDAQEAQRIQLQQHYQSINELESRATARFKVIWSVFRAHSAAEDEFIWPALRDKTKGVVNGSPCASPNYQPNQHHTNEIQQYSNTAADTINSTTSAVCDSLDEEEVVEQEEYEEDHADEERMFTMMDHLLTRLHKGLVQLHQRNAARNATNNQHPSTLYKNGIKKNLDSITNTTKEILSLAKTINQHLMVHLEKEEKNCLPLVIKHLSKSEIHDLVGQIMGKRSSDTIAQILTMAVQNLKEVDREEMVNHMKQAMMGTFFERWLTMTGWEGGNNIKDGGSGTKKGGEGEFGGTTRKRTPSVAELSVTSVSSLGGASDTDIGVSCGNKKRRACEDNEGTASVPVPTMAESLSQTIDNCQPMGEITSQENLQKLIRAVVTNPGLTPKEQNTTIQGLRASVWKRNQQLMGKIAGNDNQTKGLNNCNTYKCEYLHFPTAYYQRDVTGKVVCVWKLNNNTDTINNHNSTHDRGQYMAKHLVPKFTLSELAPTYHDGTTSGDLLGCHHYARACKLRHPITGRLFTCRLCCDQDREASAPNEKEKPPLDRYAVTEITCMKCKTLQPSAKHCVNTECELHEKGFAKYFCDICNLYDDRSRPIFHCPYCNTCRMGKGLGIDFRHCMRCNACVSLADKNHRCIPQKLQGSCPICHDTLFNSTEPLKGLRCGHVMHLSCYTKYCRGQNYTCPLCMRCMEDMSDYFSLLDQAVRMQPMPASFQNTIVNTYCQDCEKTGQCRYHFVGQKCSHCGSYNTREMGRYELSPGGQV
mmetsp:Transcript_13353/g.27993  ORF Transcript_13353/g.27993 Transcript_13353/m.27993 type:complete len:875 (-) Transcript_13353:1593-4217(-)